MREAIQAEGNSIRFGHDDATLTGEVFVPRGSESMAGLVMLQGSGAAARDNHGFFPPIINAFVSNEIAVLCYDKPGVGESTGDWRTRTLRDRAQEALVALDVLCDQNRVDAARVGFWGFSQGGWVAPFAASLSTTPNFAVSVSGPTVPPAEQNVYEIETRLRREGYSDETVARGRDWAENVMDAAREQRSFAEVNQSLFQPTKDEPWRDYWDLSTADAWHFFTQRDSITGRADIDYNPSESIANLQCPLLAVFGEKDAHVPVDRSVAVLDSLDSSSSGSPISVKVFSDADHGIRIEEGGFANGFFEVMNEWIKTHVH